MMFVNPNRLILFKLRLKANGAMGLFAKLVSVNGNDAPVDPANKMTEEGRCFHSVKRRESFWRLQSILDKDKRSGRIRLRPLLEYRRIATTIPEKPNSRLQKYITIK